MHFLQNYHKNVITYDLLNKFSYSHLNKIPTLYKIILNFGLKEKNLKQTVSGLIALELLGSQKSKLTRSSVSNISLKIRKGNPVGCKITLQKFAMYNFFANLVFNILPKIKQFDKFHYKNLTKNSFSFKIKNNFLFLELETNYEFFKNLNDLDITLVTNSQSKHELYYLLRSYKFPIQSKSLKI